MNSKELADHLDKIVTDFDALSAKMSIVANAFKQKTSVWDTIHGANMAISDAMELFALLPEYSVTGLAALNVAREAMTQLEEDYYKSKLALRASSLT